MTCWMIELTGEGRWWDGDGVDEFDFTSNPWLGVKFSTKTDAERVMFGILCHMQDLLQATEHIFDD